MRGKPSHLQRDTDRQAKRRAGERNPGRPLGNRGEVAGGTPASTVGVRGWGRVSVCVFVSICVFVYKCEFFCLFTCTFFSACTCACVCVQTYTFRYRARDRAMWPLQSRWWVPETRIRRCFFFLSFSLPLPDSFIFKRLEFRVELTCCMLRWGCSWLLLLSSCRVIIIIIKLEDRWINFFVAFEYHRIHVFILSWGLLKGERNKIVYYLPFARKK